jgi:hypothetical protein
MDTTSDRKQIKRGSRIKRDGISLSNSLLDLLHHQYRIPNKGENLA